MKRGLSPACYFGTMYIELSQKVMFPMIVMISKHWLMKTWLGTLSWMIKIEKIHVTNS